LTVSAPASQLALLVASDLELWAIKDNKEDGLEVWPESALGHFVVSNSPIRGFSGMMGIKAASATRIDK
jgi:hypothetical protein